tara:strand:+ start:2610 stop:3053 length:444 start_codon:yes stop_codon:yes gene_type:complete
MPIVIYRGKLYSKAGRVPGFPDWLRDRRVEMSQAVLNEWRHTLLPPSDFLIEGDNGIDLGDDGIPDEGWTKARIQNWLLEQGATVPGGYKTKTSLLNMVEGVLNPAPVEETVVEEAVVEEPVVEEPVVEEPVVEEAAVAEDNNEIME